MKTINISITNNSITYVADDLLIKGFYRTTLENHFLKNDKNLRSLITNKPRNIYRVGDCVLIQTKQTDHSRVDFLITEDICFEGIKLLSEHHFNYEFYDEFVEAFEMLDYQHYDDKICY